MNTKRALHIVPKPEEETLTPRQQAALAEIRGRQAQGALQAAATGGKNHQWVIDASKPRNPLKVDDILRQSTKDPA